MTRQGKKIAFFGTPSFTVEFLDLLYDQGYVPSLIVTNPDRPSGRGMKLASPAPKQWAEKNGVRVLQPEKITPDIIEHLRGEHWDLFIVIAYGAILPEALITLPKHGTINVHYSLLPKYRGATPVESAILNGDTETGVCIQKMRYALDSGPLIAEQKVSIDPSDTTVTLRNKLNQEALLLLPTTLLQLFDETVSPKEQDETKATICKKIKKSDGAIDLSSDPSVLDRTFRALSASPGVYTTIVRNGVPVRLKIKKAHLEEGAFVLDVVIPENGKPLSREEFDRWVKA